MSNENDNKSDNNDAIKQINNDVNVKQSLDEQPEIKIKNKDSVLSEDSPEYALDESNEIDKKPFYMSLKFIIATLFIIGFVGIIYYLSLSFKSQSSQLLQLKTKINSDIMALDKKHNYQNSITKLQSSVLQLETNVKNNTIVDNSELQNQINKQATQLEQLRQQLVNAAAQLNRSEQFKTIEWQLAEAKYLLRIAQQRIVMEKDVVGALSVLVAVDDVLLSTQDVSLYNIREVLTQDKSKLEVVQKMDIEGVYIQLGNIRNQVEQFKYFAEAINEIENKKSFKEIFFDSFNVRDISGEYVGQLDPVLHNIAKQSLVLMLEQSQSSLLNNQQDIFELSLAKCKVQLTQYFSTETQFDWIIGQLNTLESMKLSQELPDVLNTIQALDNYLINLSK
ncbi:MAG: uroporphyrinogen-III C-methyltransferase [Saccharospirillaceae bacterium]|nr:uroporphyrinogen-III C-methyltransferase [Pseudomonadales bacterium]NRB77076.1 uroporphyrinogen-III C-methyltransferase [Saccharospirillaceae bacterium]